MEANTNPKAISSSAPVAPYGKGECNGAFQPCQLWTGGVSPPWVGAAAYIVGYAPPPSVSRPPPRLPLSSRGCSRVGRMATDVRAHITGTVWKILVKPGDEVTADQTLVILESMKMEMPLESPEAGRVASVAVSEGATVDEGDLILSLESK